MNDVQTFYTRFGDLLGKGAGKRFKLPKKRVNDPQFYEAGRGKNRKRAGLSFGNSACALLHFGWQIRYVNAK
jgi:hypothetical protein